VLGSTPLSYTDLRIVALVGLLFVPVVAPEKWSLRRME
jgi:hypothetical protein